MWLIKRNPVIYLPRSNRTTVLRLFSQPATAATSDLSEYTDKPIYPEIINNSYESKKLRKYEEWHNQIKNLNTIEEKLIKINIPRYYGHKSVMLSDGKFPYNCLPLTQHYTRTVLTETQPNYLTTNPELVNSFTEQIKSDVVEAIEFCTDFYRRKYGTNSEIAPEERDKIYGELIVEQINNLLLDALSSQLKHLSEIEIDVQPRHEAFWWVGEVNPPKSLQKSRKGVKWQEDFVNEPIDRAVQYLGTPYLAIRHRLPLSEMFETGTIKDDSAEKTNDIPVFNFDARTIGYYTDHRHGTNIPGYWPGSIHEYGMLSYQKRNHMCLRPATFDAKENQEALHAQAIQSSFAWLFGQACYQGFSSFQDITYPLCTQTIITNGQLWSFYVYQLDTTLIHSNNPTNNPKVNKCWGTKELKLFDEVDENCKCIGFNEEVLKNLIQFYMNTPSERNINFKPYLGEVEQKIADIKDHERRVFLERTFKHMTANRPRHRLVPEIYMWEKLYKIDNNTRPLEARRRSFELNINPFKRRMDQHCPVYVPKAIRKEGPKRENKFEKSYYP